MISLFDIVYAFDLVFFVGVAEIVIFHLSLVEGSIKLGSCDATASFIECLVHGGWINLKLQIVVVTFTHLVEL